MGRGIAAAPEGWDQIGHAVRRTDGAPEQEPWATRQLCQSPSSLGWRGSPTVGGFFLLGLVIYSYCNIYTIIIRSYYLYPYTVIILPGNKGFPELIDYSYLRT